MNILNSEEFLVDIMIPSWINFPLHFKIVLFGNFEFAFTICVNIFYIKIIFNVW